MADLPNTTTDTPEGFLVGVDPAQPVRTAADWASVAQETIAGGQQVGGTPTVLVEQPAPQQNQRFYTEEDIIKIRQEEKSKLYSRIETMDEQLRTLAEEKQAREEALRKEQEEALAQAKAKEEAELETRDLLLRKEQEWQEEISSLRNQYEQDRAVFEMERKLKEIDDYRNARLAQESEYIMPELRDLVTGNTQEEIESSIENMKVRTSAIVQQVAEQAGFNRQAQRGVAPTAPPIGPLEQLSQYETITPEDIRTMDMETYRKNRDKLLPAAGRAYNGF